MRNKIFITFFWLIVLLIPDEFAQIRQIKDAKSLKRTEIRKFDFLNSTYEAGCAGEKVKVQNGHFAPNNQANFYFEFDVSVSYGDLTSDGVEEALVVLQCSGAVQNYDEGKIYTVRNHILVKLVELEVGTKNNGAIISAKIKNGRIIVKRGPSPDLCKNSTDAAEETAVFRLRRKKLQQIGKSVCKQL